MVAPKRKSLRPVYETDELAMGVAVAVALHALIAGPFIYRAFVPPPIEDEEKPLVGKPVIAAALLKLGKPIDPKKLPDRIVPKARTAPQKDLTASKDDPAKVHDAGAPPPNALPSDLQNLISKTDPFAEDAGKARPESKAMPRGSMAAKRPTRTRSTRAICTRRDSARSCMIAGSIRP